GHCSIRFECRDILAGVRRRVVKRKSAGEGCDETTYAPRRETRQAFRRLVSKNVAAYRIERPKLARLDVDPVEPPCGDVPQDAFTQDVLAVDDKFGLLHRCTLQGRPVLRQLLQLASWRCASAKSTAVGFTPVVSIL